MLPPTPTPLPQVTLILLDIRSVDPKAKPILIENMYRSKEVIKIINKTYWA